MPNAVLRFRSNPLTSILIAESIPGPLPVIAPEAVVLI